MPVSFLLLVLGILSAVSFYVGRRRAIFLSHTHSSKMHSLPVHYGTFVAIWCGLPAFGVVLFWTFCQSYVINGLVLAGLPANQISDPGKVSLVLNKLSLIVQGELGPQLVDPAVWDAAQHLKHLQMIANLALVIFAFCCAFAGFAVAYLRLSPGLRARNLVEDVLRYVMIICAMIALLLTLGIVLALVTETIHFFSKVNPLEFLFGLDWNPQTAIRSDQVVGKGAFGAVPLFAGTILVTLIAMCVAVPVGVFSAIFMHEYASRRFRAIAKPTQEILAGIPSVVYGFFAVLTVAPFLKHLGSSLGLDVSSESALAVGLVMGVMIIPFVSSLSDDAIAQVPQSLRDGSYALGATKSETIRFVILPAALPGIVGAVLLAVSRAMGETMIVLMAAGLMANLTLNPLQSVSTMTVQIVTILIGDQEFDSAKTLSAFALGLVLFLVTLVLNIVALRVVRKYRERYE